MFGEIGGFDSLNPYLVRGRAPWGVRTHVVESLMARSYDEPFSLYGLLAERMETPPDRSWVRFDLDARARFSTGAAVTVDDVIWSLETLRDEARPSFRSYYSQVSEIQRIGERGVRFVFEAPNRELPLLLGLMPILSKASFEGREFADPSLEPIIGSGPYVIAEAEAGRRVIFQKNPEYWARELPVKRGIDNAQTLEYVYFRDNGPRWEAFTAGAIDLYREDDPARWSDAYDFPAAIAGDVLKAEIPHARASGMRGFVFNTRRAPFDDRRVRIALSFAFDYAWANARFFAGGFRRIDSYFSGSSLGFRDPAGPLERSLLAPFEATLPEGTLEAGWRPPAGAGDGRNRRGLRRARALLEEAGYTLEGGRFVGRDGAPLTFEILLGESRDERLATVWRDALETLGVAVSMRTVDGAQYAERLNRFDFDVTVRLWWLSLSPGEEQRFYWGSDSRDTEGTRNFMGVADPAVDAMVDAMLAAEDRESFEAAVRALDRVLSSGVYVVPFGALQSDLVAHHRRIGVPERASLYGFRPETLWAQPD